MWRGGKSKIRLGGVVLQAHVAGCALFLGGIALFELTINISSHLNKTPVYHTHHLASTFLLL